MNKQIVAAIALSVLSVGLMSHATAQQATPPADSKADSKADPKAAPAATEDIVYMRDGRVLRGQILAETSRFITLEYVDPNIKSKTKLNLSTSEIAEVMRDQAVAGGATTEEEPADDAAEAETSAPKSDVKSDWVPSYGAARFQSSDSSVPSLYIVPMGGQFGTDVRAEVYKPVIEDIRKHKPDVVVIDIKAADSFPPDLMAPNWNFEVDPKLERGMLEFETYNEIVHMFRKELADVPQVVWIQDSDGISALVAMAWDQIYMRPGARFGGAITVLEQSGADKWADTDVRAKMMAAWLGHAKALLVTGGYSEVLADAMLQKENKLSASWKGREVAWQLNTDGEYLVDESDKHTVNFVAKTAEDLCLSKGTAENLDDLALLLNMREYRLIEGKQNALTIGYVEDWRRAFGDCRKNMQDYEKYLSWATGEDTIAYLGKAKRCLEDVLSSLERYKAVEIRLGNDFGLDKVTLITYIEQLKERLRALQQRGGNRGGSGAGGGRAGGRGGEGPR